MRAFFTGYLAFIVLVLAACITIGLAHR